MALSATRVRAVKEPGRHSDGGGLHLYISKTGSKSWVLRITVDGRRRDMGLGAFPSVSLAHAREKTTGIRAAVAEGRDPLAEKHVPALPTFREAAYAVHKANRPRWRNARHIGSWMQTLERHAMPTLGNTPLDRTDRGGVLRDGVPRQVALTDRSEHEFFVPEEARWPALVGATMNMGETLNVASHAIEEANIPRLDGVLAGTNWNDEQKLGSPANRERIIRSLLTHFGGLDLSDENLREDAAGGGNVLGDAYEYLINQFADDAGKKGGEFYTPRSVVRLIVELLKPQEGMRICDPTAGSGGMLIYAAQYVREHGGDLRNLALHGQERNLGTLAIGKLNLLLHGLRAARLEPGHVIAEPGLADREGRLLSYDRVIANPPFSLKNWGHDFAPNDPHHRFDRYARRRPGPGVTWPSSCTCWR